ncbi:ABC transporter ATP-binding protein [Rhodoluna sp.]|jgi:branched-chain amino acid transport system ATP-binding protein|uniref:ABC transporter ATP-binding protein n=1 Tax=Rhodoluna sp. TaxID=1969481 RepID=UPI0025FAD954|nr:ABC transporter ATP-binding protein [Rhodoluna sp.]
MSLLKIESISAGYGDAPAVSGVSFSVEPGQLVALVGANGAGKSTLLRVIAGAHKIWGGSVSFHDQDITATQDFERARQGISLVPEGRRLFASLTVKENLNMGAAARRPGLWNLDSVVEALPMIKPLLSRNASRLSGGQQQAVAIGRALMSNPELLLLDEVSLGLAPIIVDEIYESLSTVRKSGLGVVLVEQDLSRTIKVADYIVCMLEGHNVLEGAAAKLSRESITAAYFGHSIESFDDATKKGGATK